MPWRLASQLEDACSCPRRRALPSGSPMGGLCLREVLALGFQELRRGAATQEGCPRMPHLWGALTSHKSSPGEELYFVVEAFKCKKPSKI